MKTFKTLVLIIITSSYASSSSASSSSASSSSFEGIAKLSNCSGALVRFEGQSYESKAMVITNGHCVVVSNLVRNLLPDQVIINTPSERSFEVFDKNKKLHQMSSDKLIFATMTGTDVAIYQLTQSYAEILEQTQIQPLVISPRRPKQGLSIKIISGLWSKVFSCHIDGFAEKRHEGPWKFFDSIRYSHLCQTQGGTSGSPIIDSHTWEVIGIHNTGNIDGEKCTIDNACEVTSSGDIYVHKGINYGQQLSQIYSCLDNNYQINFQIAGCQL